MLFSTMSTFSERLKSEIKYKGFVQKELAALANVKKRAMDMYVGSQCSMPPADVAVKIAKALDVSVEYLVTGKEYKAKNDMDKYRQFRKMLDNLLLLPQDMVESFDVMIQAAAEHVEAKKTQDSNIA